MDSVVFRTPADTAVATEIDALLSRVRFATGVQPISNVCGIRDQANELLARAGYVALAQIGSQQLSRETGSQLKITIVSAKITAIRVIGDIGRYRSVLKDRSDALMALDPVNKHDVERILLLVDDLPGINVHLALRSAEKAPGEVIGELSVETQQATVLANIQNYGSKQLGPTILSARGEFYGLTGLADRTYVGYSNSTDWKEIHVLQAGHDFALGSDIRLGARASYALSNPDIVNLDLRSRSLIAGLELTMPLVRSLAGRLSLTSGFELLNQRTQIYQNASKIPFTQDKLRVLFGRLDGSLRLLGRNDRMLGRLSGSLEVRQGTGLFGASKRGIIAGNFAPSRFDGDPQATVVRGEFSAEYRPVSALTLAVSALGQWASKPLLNLEEFSLGSLTYGRGYDPGANGGDRVAAFRIEPRLRLPFKGPVSVELTAFHDSVRLWNLDNGSSEDNRLLRSVGGGVRIVDPGRFALELTYAQPLDKALTFDAKRPPARFLISFTTQLFPWGRR